MHTILISRLAKTLIAHRDTILVEGSLAPVAEEVDATAYYLLVGMCMFFISGWAKCESK